MTSTPSQASDTLSSATGTTPEERSLAMMTHLLTLLGYFGLVLNFLPPLIIFLVKKDESEFVADQAKEALNFQIAVLLANLLAVILCATFFLACIGIPMIILLNLAQIVFVIIAAIRAGEGQRYRYPHNVRFI